MNTIDSSTKMYPTFSAGLCSVSKVLDKSLAEVHNKDIQRCIKKIRHMFDDCHPIVINAVTAQYDDFIRKYEMCNDIVIRKTIDKALKRLRKKDKRICYNELCKLEVFIDSVNIADNKYMPLNSPTHPIGIVPYIGYLQNPKNELNQAIKSKDTKTSCNIQENVFNKYYSIPKQVYQIFKILPKEKTENFDFNDFYENSRFVGIKEFIKRNKTKKSLGDYLWKKYYLGTIKEKYAHDTEVKNTIINLLLFFKDEFKTRIFFDLNDKDIFMGFSQTLKTEFLIWKNHAKNKFRLPGMFDITQYRFGFLSDMDLGECHNNKNEIALNSCAPQIALRHEIIHSVDSRFNDESLQKENVSTKFIDELKQYCHVEDVQYAFKRWCEYNAVALGNCDIMAKGNYNPIKYSKEHKKMMSEHGVPEYVFDLESREEYYMKLLDIIYNEEQHKSALKEITEYYKGAIPEDIGEILLYGSKCLETVQKAIHLKKDMKPVELITKVNEILTNNH